MNNQKVTVGECVYHHFKLAAIQRHKDLAGYQTLCIAGGVVEFIF